MEPVLAGVKVVEAAEWVLVPGAAAILASWGAEVIKVEHPKRGDPLRGSLGSLGYRPDFNFYAEQNNHSKRSVGVDLSKADGQRILHRLVEDADVFLTSFREPTRQRWNIAFEDLAAVNPRLVYGRSSGQGQRGPDAQRQGYDTISYWARGGVGHMASPPGGPARFMPAGGFGDVQGALALASGVLGGLYRRSVSGRGGLVDVSLLGMAVWDLYEVLQVTRVLGIDAKEEFRPGGLPNNPLTQLYVTLDDRVVALSMLDSDRYWTAFCTAMGFPELEHDTRFATFAARAEHRDTLCELISRRISSMALDEAHRRLVEHRCAFSSFATLDEVLADPQVLENQYLLDHPAGDDRFVVAPPVQFDEQPAAVRSVAPEVGQHTEEVLLELDYTWEQIIELKDADVLI